MVNVRSLVALLVSAVGALLLVAPPAGAASPPGQLSSGEQLTYNQSLRSADGGTFGLTVDQYGRVSVEGPVGVIWRPAGNGGQLVMQGDGNLVNYDPSTGRAVWASGTGVPGSIAVMQGDGNLVVYAPGGRAVWASKSDRPTSGALGDRLLPDNSLMPGGYLTSTNGAYRAIMQGDGNFVVYGPAGPVWASGTAGGNTYAALQPDGNLVVYGSALPAPAGPYLPFWHTRTANWSGTLLVLQDDGALVLYRVDGTALWSSKTSGGEKMARQVLTAGPRLSLGAALWSPDYRYRAIMQFDGNFVVYGPNGANWASRTGWAGASVFLTSGGDAVVAGSPLANAVWHSGTAGNAGAVMVLQNDGNLVVYRANGTAAWASLSPWTWNSAPLPLSPRNGWW